MKSSILNRVQLVAMLGLASGLSECMPPAKKVWAKKIKQCVQCGIEHDHNNGFCSSECCKLNKIKVKS